MSEFKFLRVRPVCEKLGISANTLYRLVNDKSENFPKQIKISPQLVAWDSREIEAWMERKIREAK